MLHPNLIQLFINNLPWWESSVSDLQRINDNTQSHPSSSSWPSRTQQKTSMCLYPTVFPTIAKGGVRFWCVWLTQDRETQQTFIEEVSRSWVWRLHRSFWGASKEIKKTQLTHKAKHCINSEKGTCWEYAEQKASIHRVLQYQVEFYPAGSQKKPWQVLQQESNKVRLQLPSVARMSIGLVGSCRAAIINNKGKINNTRVTHVPLGGSSFTAGNKQCFVLHLVFLLKSSKELGLCFFNLFQHLWETGQENNSSVGHSAFKSSDWAHQRALISIHFPLFLWDWTLSPELLSWHSVKTLICGRVTDVTFFLFE